MGEGRGRHLGRETDLEIVDMPTIPKGGVNRGILCLMSQANKIACPRVAFSGFGLFDFLPLWRRPRVLVVILG
jgi:hypothetical protein